MKPNKIDLAKKYNLKVKDIIYRGDGSGRYEWICPHGIGHTIYSPDGEYIHGCDGCCKDIDIKDDDETDR